MNENEIQKIEQLFLTHLQCVIFSFTVFTTFQAFNGT